MSVGAVQLTDPNHPPRTSTGNDHQKLTAKHEFAENARVRAAGTVKIIAVLVRRPNSGGRPPAPHSG